MRSAVLVSRLLILLLKTLFGVVQAVDLFRLNNCTFHQEKLDKTVAGTKLAIEDQPRMLVKELLDVECRTFYVLCAKIEAHRHMGSCPGHALITLYGKATKPREDEFRKRIGRIIARTLAGEARMEMYKDRIAERKRVRERRRARVERGAGDVPMEPVNKNDEQVAVRHADASGGYIAENQHDENRMRDIHPRWQKRFRGSE